MEYRAAYEEYIRVFQREGLDSGKWNDDVFDCVSFEEFQFVL